MIMIMIMMASGSRRMERIWGLPLICRRFTSKWNVRVRGLPLICRRFTSKWNVRVRGLPVVCIQRTTNSVPRMVLRNTQRLFVETHLPFHFQKRPFSGPPIYHKRSIFVFECFNVTCYSNTFLTDFYILIQSSFPSFNILPIMLI